MSLTTRRSVTAALAQQPINGIGVRVVQGSSTRVVYRYGRDAYKVITVGDLAGARDEFYHSSRALMTALFGKEAR